MSRYSAKREEDWRLPPFGLSCRNFNRPSMIEDSAPILAVVRSLSQWCHILSHAAATAPLCLPLARKPAGLTHTNPLLPLSIAGGGWAVGRRDSRAGRRTHRMIASACVTSPVITRCLSDLDHEVLSNSQLLTERSAV